VKIKLDQNMDPRGAAILRQAGHDVLTIKEQNLTDAEDEVIAEVCQRESRCLITLDLDFANTILYAPQESRISGPYCVTPSEADGQKLVGIGSTIKHKLANHGSHP
jgi:hypothetical protein